MGIAHEEAGLSVLVRLPQGADDMALARHARRRDVAPSPLSWWCEEPGAAGLLLGVTNVSQPLLDSSCARLAQVLRGRGC